VNLYNTYTYCISFYDFMIFTLLRLGSIYYHLLKNLHSSFFSLFPTKDFNPAGEISKRSPNCTLKHKHKPTRRNFIRACRAGPGYGKKGSVLENLQ
jgi:hypothetical protein